MQVTHPIAVMQRLMEAHNIFVTNTADHWPHDKVAQPTTKPKENETMTEFQTERAALDHDLRKSYGEHLDKLRNHYHINPAQPKTIREAIQMVKDGKFDRSDDDKFLDRKCGEYDGSPLYNITFREKPADMDGFRAAEAKLNEAHRAHSLKAKIHAPAEALKHVEDFRKATFH